jgi:hypothetical protein
VKSEFRRINFFKGFFTQAEDWRKAQEYHIEKRKLHNKFSHTPGVVVGCLDNLKVVTKTRGTYISVDPGCAIDGEGRELYLPRREDIKFAFQEYRPPVTVYIVIRYNEEKDDLRPNPKNPEYADYAFIKESPLVEITATKPDNLQAIELGRIKLAKGVTRIRDAENPENPRANEIDLRHVMSAGVEIGRISLAMIGTIVRQGEISVTASGVPTPSADDTNVLIEKVAAKDAHRFYLVSAYPLKPARVLWRIESSVKGEVVEYRLYFKNFSKAAVKVSYVIHRLY